MNGQGDHDERASWNAAVAAQGGSFLQSFEWGELQEAFGRSVFRLRGDGWLCQLVEHELPFGLQYMYAPRGPVLEVGRRKMEDGIRPFVEQACAVGHERKEAFLRVDPPLDAAVHSFESRGFKDMDRSVQPKRSLIINLRKSEGELLTEMREKTRYNIRVAERHGVECRIRKVEDGSFEEFYRLLQQTGDRQKIDLHPRRYYEQMTKTIPDIPSLVSRLSSSTLRKRLYVASYRDYILATALVLCFGSRATYAHGGSSIEHKNVMAPYALHWQIMRDAKAAGFEEYDFGGVDEKRWPGLTRFKSGFGGSVEEFPNAQELPLSAWRYWLYRVGRTMRKGRRRG